MKGILKKDKTGFSKEELKRQKSIANVLIVLIFVGTIMFIVWFIENNAISRITLIMLLFLGLLAEFFWKRVQLCEDQLEKIKKQDKKEAIFDNIKRKDFKDLKLINREMQIKLFEEAVKKRTIRLETLDENEIVMMIGDSDVYIIKKEDILKYFSTKKAVI